VREEAELWTAFATAKFFGGFGRWPTPLEAAALLASELGWSFLRAARTIWRGTRDRNGAVLLLVPGFPQPAGAFDQALGQLRRFTPESLRQTVTAAGLVPEVVRPVNLLGGIAWWAAIRMARPGRPTKTLVTLYDRLMIPAERAIERRIQPSFGQSILCVARVPEATGA
jgi:hypothetical protein